MLTKVEVDELNRLADIYIKDAKVALKTKAIDRYTRNRKNFRAVASDTGAGAESLEKSLADDGINILINKYMGAVLSGRSENKRQPPIDAIKKWIERKGLDLNPYAVAKSMGKHGNSIWQKHRGADSGLLADVNIDKEIDKSLDVIAEAKIDKYLNQILSKLAA